MQRIRTSAFRARRFAACSGITLAWLLATAAGAQAQSLAGPSVTAGTANVSGLGTNAVVVNQSSDKAVIDWRSFSVDKGSSVRFVQPGATSIALNRVTGTDASQINGSLTGNGQVWLLNPNGVLIGASGSVTAAGFLGTTHAISNADFLAGNYRLDGSAATGSVINQGRIVADGGYAVLAGTHVANSGLIQANLGQVVLGAGKGFALDLVGDKLLSFAVTQPVDLVASGGAVVDNSGTLRAQGGSVVLTARSAAAVVGSVVNTTGLIDATTARSIGGEIVLDGGEGSLVYAAGTLDASGKAAGQSGGAIALLGETVVVGAGGVLDASGDAGGGTINVGGGWQGASIGGHASAVRAGVAASATLNASATGNGDGGTISLWSETGNTASQTLAYGTFLANGGALGGNGGRIETSGHYLDTTGARGGAAALTAGGKAGLWLLDPYNVEIVAAGSVSSSGATTNYFANGVGDWQLYNNNPQSRVYATTTYTSGATTYVSPIGGNFAVIDTGNVGNSGYTDTYLYKTFVAAQATTVDFYTLNIANSVNLGLYTGVTDYNGTGNQTYNTPQGVWQHNSVTFPAGTSYNIYEEIFNYYSGTSRTGSAQLALAVGSGGAPIYNGAFAGNGMLQTWTPTGSPSKIDVSQITGFLNAGTNVQITTGAPNQGTEAGNITVNAAIAKTAGNAATLQFDAANNIVVNQAIGSTSNALNVTFNAGGGIQLASTVNTNGGTLALNATGATTQTAALITGTLALANTGTYTLNNAGNAFATLSGSAGSASLANGGATTINGLTVGNGLSLTGAGTITVGQAIGATGANPINVSLAATAGNIALNAAVNTGGGALTLGTGGTATQSAALTTDTLSLAGAGTYTLTNTGNALSTLSGTAGSANLVDSVATTINGLSATGTFGLTGTGAIGFSGTESFGGATTIVTPGAITLASGTRITDGGLLALEAGTNFVNNAGSSAITTTGAGRWLIYSQAPSSDTFGSLASGNTAVWSATPASTPPGSAPSGNRYLFAYSPTLAVTPTATHKTYGDMLDPASVGYTTFGLVSAASYGDVFTQDVLTGAAGLDTRYGGFSAASYTGTYTLQSTQGSLSAPGYTFALGQATLTIDPRALILTALTDNRVYDRTTSSLLTPTYSGLVNGDTIRNLSQAFDSANAGNRNLVVDNGYVISTSGGQQGGFNYTVTRQSVAGTITPKALTASLTGATGKVYDGGTAATLASGNYSLTGVIAGDSVALNDPASGTYADKNVGAGKAVTATGLALTGNSVGNYTVNASASANIGNITAKALTAGLTGATGKVYDGDTTAALTAANYQLGGVVSGDIVVLNDPASGTYADKNVGTGKVVTATGLVISGNDAGNYTVNTSASANIGSITAKALTASLTGSTDKVYDGTTTAALTTANYQLSGVVSGDSVALNDPASGTYADKNVGSSKTVTATGVSISGGDAGNYTVNTSASANVGSITAKALTASLTGSTGKVYDGTTTAALTTANYQLGGVVSGDSVALNDPASGTYADKTVGTGKAVTATGMAISGSDAGNYTVNSSASANIGSVTAKALTANLTGSTGKVYDGTTTAALTTANYQLGGVVSGDSVSLNDPVSGTYADKNVGTGKAVTATGLAISGRDAGNYTLNTSASAAIGSITAKALTAGLTGATDKVYDGTTTAALTIANYQLGGVVSGDSVVLNNPASGTYADKNVGTGRIVTATGLVISGNDAGNYTVKSSTSANIGSITAKALTANLTSATGKVYDGTTTASLMTANYQLNGVVSGDSVALNNPASGTYADKNVGTGKVVTATGLVISGNDAGNYTVNTSASANIGSITAKALTASLTGATGKVYDGTTTASLTTANYQLNGVVSGDSVALNDPASGTYADKNVGANKAVTAMGLAISGGDAGNYIVNTSTSANIGSISAKALTASLTGATGKVYDGTTTASLTAANYQLAGVVSGDSVALNDPASGTYADKNVGANKAVIAMGLAISGSDAGNYTVNASTSANIGSITAKALTAGLVGTVSRLANGSTDATLTPDNFVLAGFVAGESGQVTQTAGTYDSAGAGTSITVSTTLAASDFLAGAGTSLGNYTLPLGVVRGSVGTITPQVLVAIAAQPIVPQVTATVTPSSTAAATPTAAADPVTSASGPVPVEVASTASAMVSSMPPSPVAATKPPTPADSADMGDPILAAASSPSSDKPAPHASRQSSVTTSIAGGLLTEQRPLPPHTGQVAGVDAAFSGSGAAL